jgi:hypothetical protein
MSKDGTATRLARKLADLTKLDKLAWKEADFVYPGAAVDLSFETSVEDGTTVLIGETAVKRTSILSYVFWIHENAETVFEVFAEGIPAEPTEEQREMWRTLKDLYCAARDSARGTKRKVERFEQLLQKLA